MKSFLSFAALAVTALALQGLPAKAQTSGSSSTSSSGSTSNSSSGSASGASTTSGASSNSQQQRTNQRVNSTTNNSIPITFNSGGGGAGNGANGANAVDPAGANGANGSNGGGGFSNNPPFYSQSDITVRTTPTVYAPPVSGGNPCTLAVSGGVSVIGWGAAAGGTFVDQDCADRQKIAMIHNAGYAQAARELMCNDKATYMAFRGTSTPCNPRPQWDGTQPGQPMVQQPVPLAPPPQQQVIIKDRSNLPRCSRTITDNCFAG
jgi:hypothetical protein